MTNEDYSKVPPPHLLKKFSEQDLATRAAQWGADQELKACLNYMNGWGAVRNSFGGELADELRAARRALEQLDD